MREGPPRLGSVLLAVFLPAALREPIQGDLLELFEERARTDGAGAARARYWRDVATILWHARGGLRRADQATLARRGPTEVLSMMLWSALNELKHASRMLARHPGYAAAAALTLALGIGATVAIFTVVNAVLLRPLAYPDSDRIVIISQHAPGLNMADIASSPGLVREYGRHARSLAAVGGYRSQSLNFSDGTAPERLRAASVTPNFLTILSVHPAIGRPFQAADSQKNAPGVTILTDTLWRTRFGANPDVIGRTIRLDGRPAEVVGVMPADFQFVDRQVRLLVPMQIDPASPFGNFGLTAVARLAPSATVSAARDEMRQLQSRIPEWFPDMTSAMLAQFGWSVTVDRWRDRIVADVSRTLWVLLATVGFVLLIAVTNVANLFLVRAEGRQREIALRSALGAGRMRIAWVFLAESLLLAGAGGAVGVTLAAWSTRLLVSYGPAQIPRLHEVHFDARVGAFAAALTLLAGLALGLLAAGHAAGRDTAAIVREGGRANTAGRARHRMRRLLIVTQMATAVVLLVASGLLVRSAGRLAAVDPGFDADNIVTAGVTLGAQPDRDRAAATYRAVLAEMGRLPDVESVGATSALPVGPAGLSGGSFEIKSRPTAEAALPPFALYTSVTSGYFETLRIPLVQGRLPEPGDSEQHRPVVWVNRTFASNFLGDRAVGDSIKFDQQWHEIVGVVGDVKTFDLREPARAMAYLPLGDPLVGTDAMYAVIRTRANVALPASALRASVDAVDRSAPLTTIRTMKDIVDSSVAQTSFTMVLLTIAALTALGLGVVGLYGVISYVVAQRTAEIGIRLALGARSANVYGLVLGQGLAAALTGVVIGLAGAAASARLIRSLLFEVSARDPATYAAAAITLTLVSLIATYVPARRAAAIDPSAALRM